jgi:hypothetical protein
MARGYWVPCTGDLEPVLRLVDATYKGRPAAQDFGRGNLTYRDSSYILLITTMSYKEEW